MTKSGNPCKNWPLADSAYCHLHQPVAEVEPPEVDIPVEEEAVEERDLQFYLRQALNESIGRIQKLAPDYVPPPFTPARMKSLTGRVLKEAAPYLPTDRVRKIQDQIGGDLLDVETWKGLWYVFSYSVQYQLDFLKRRFTGEYEVDEWGMDWEFIEAVRPLFNFLYTYYWRVETTGLEHIPDYTRGLIVANHSGQLPFDATMIATALFTEHPAQRLVRNLYGDWYPRVPLLTSVLEKLGQVLDSSDNGISLLEQDELVAAYPEGYRGLGKPYQERYKLAEFSDNFVKIALATGAPIVPTAVVGAEEIYVSLANSNLLAKIARTPYFLISLRFPWFGLLGLIPYPTKWTIDFGEPIETEAYGPEAVADTAVVKKLTKQTRDAVNELLVKRLIKRKSILFRS
jgi:1-acyl-sn-glycerol-3-phosphate acyltransferase